jgi:small subunit ribosomal protein S6
MRVYEELFIVKPDAPEEEVDAYIGQIKDLITNGKGTVDKADKWGTRKLAYRVQKYNEGIYVLLQFSSSPELVKEDRAAHARDRHGDQVHHGSHRREDQEDREAQEAARQTGRPQTSTAAHGSTFATRHTGTPVPAAPAGRSSGLTRRRGVPPRKTRNRKRRLSWRNKEAEDPSAVHRGPPAATRPWAARSSISGARSCAVFA